MQGTSLPSATRGEPATPKDTPSPGDVTWPRDMISVPRRAWYWDGEQVEAPNKSPSEYIMVLPTWARGDYHPPSAGRPQTPTWVRPSLCHTQDPMGKGCRWPRVWVGEGRWGGGPRAGSGQPMAILGRR